MELFVASGVWSKTGPEQKKCGMTGWHEGPRPKSLDLEENFKPNMRYFVAILRLDLCIFWKTFAKKRAFFGSKQCVMGKKCTIPWYIAYHTESNLQKRRICRENIKYAPDENFYGHFCPRWKAANFCWMNRQKYSAVNKWFAILVLCWWFTFGFNRNSGTVLKQCVISFNRGVCWPAFHSPLLDDCTNCNFKQTLKRLDVK